MEDRLREMGATLVLVSPELPEQTRNLRRAKKLKSDILVDEDNQLAEKMNLAFTLPDYLQGLYKQFGIDLEKSQGNDRWRLPMPARYVVDGSGKIVAAEVNPDYTDRPEPAELLDLLKMA